MKKIIIILLLLVLLGSNSDAINPAILSGISSSGSCADCSGTASFVWEINSATVGDTGYSPCGCVSATGDSSATENGDISISSGSAVVDDVVSDDGQDYYNFDNGADVLSDDTVGTVFIRFKVTTWADYTQLFKIYADVNNQINVRLTSSNDLEASHVGDTNSTGVVLAGNNVSTGTEYIVRYRWEVGRGTTDSQLTLYSSAMSQLDDDSDLDSITAFAAGTQAGDGAFRVANRSNVNGANFTIYYVRLYQEWLDADPNL